MGFDTVVCYKHIALHFNDWPCNILVQDTFFKYELDIYAFYEMGGLNVNHLEFVPFHSVNVGNVQRG